MMNPLLILSGVLALLISFSAAAQEETSQPVTPLPIQEAVPSSTGTDLFELPLERLLDIEVTSVSKRSEKVSGAAAAVYVITQDDIRRSGATSIPEALRMAPGLNVARIDSNKWAISARGFNRQYSNKLLVLIDGRSVYTPLFSGVYWDEQDVVLEDIDRIEVIRGPGGTLWGANAVNGVINIITKKAQDTQGTLISTALGSYEKGHVTIREGGATDEGHYRVYAKHNRYDEFTLLSTGADANDDWDTTRGGFRMDNDYADGQKLTIQGDAYRGGNNATAIVPKVGVPATLVTTSAPEVFSGGNILARWDNKINNDSSVMVQTYVDYVDRDITFLEQKRITLDFDVQHSITLDARNEFIYGAGVRHISDSLTNSPELTYTPINRTDSLFSAFAQDKFYIVPDVWSVVVGSKFEHNSLTGFEYQPNVRTTWVVDDKQTLWGSIARAVRTPSRGEDGLTLSAGISSGLLVQQVGNPGIESEEQMAYELGYRYQPNNRMFLDVATFFSDYDNLRTFERGTIVTTIPFIANNNGSGESYGVEVAGDWIITPQWNVAGSYTYLNVTLHTNIGSTDIFLNPEEGNVPHNVFHLRSSYNLQEDVELDNALYYVDNLSGASADSYIRFDTRIGWKATDYLDLSFVGQNLFDDRHKEFSAPLYGSVTEVPRSLYGKATLHF